MCKASKRRIFRLQRHDVATMIGIWTTIALVLSCSAIVGLSADMKSASFRQVFPDKPNEISFDRVPAKFLRMAIYSSLGGDPAIDELLVHDSSEQNADNLARAEGAVVSASSCIEGYEIHKITNLTDGRFGNGSAWVAASAASREKPQWVQLEWTSPVDVSRVVFSRDRDGVYSDRVPMNVEILVSLDGNDWTSVANLRGASFDPQGNGGLTPENSPLFTNAPTGVACELGLSEFDVDVGNELSSYDRRLQAAFLAEENAILKIAGFASIEPWLLQRHYPEFVEPKRRPEDVLPLPTLSEAPDFGLDYCADAFAEKASCGAVYAFAPGSFAAGPQIVQRARVAIFEDSLYVTCEGNRFLSENIAMIGVENLPTRGFLVYRAGKIFWRQIDELDGRQTGSEVELSGAYDPDNNEVRAVVPLEYLPDLSERGAYVAMGIGARWIASGGRPIHFKPADFALIPKLKNGASNRMTLDVVSHSRTPLKLSLDSKEVVLNPGERVSFDASDARYGIAGLEKTWRAYDENACESFRVVVFDYEPCFRPFCQLVDAIKRSESGSFEERDSIDFHKTAAIPGAVNPRYVDQEGELAKLGLSDERQELEDFFQRLTDELQKTNVENQGIKARALALWQEYLHMARQDVVTREQRRNQILHERELFWRLRLLKRDFFLANPDLEALEHILANKRQPFWPSHNYSDLFDSTWNPGGAIVMIDMPFEGGKLVPERATTRELVRAGDGVIRNPSPSFDATKVYYAFRESPDEYFRIYELDLTTNETKRISALGPFHDFWPTELPDGGLAFISTRCKKKFICWRPQAFVLYRMDKNGENIRPLSHANLSEFAPSICDDGRIMWTRSEYVDKGADYGHTLWTIRADGTSPELTFGNTINLPQGYANGRRVPDSDEVSCVMISHFGDLNGPVALIDLAKGPHDPAAIHSITPEVPWPGFWAKTETFREPYPISKDVFLVAHAALERFGLYLIDRYGNRELLVVDDDIDTVCPQPFAPREIPPVTGSPANPELKEQNLGRFSVANVYRGLEGQVERGAAKYLRVCQEMPTPLQQLEDGSYQADHEPFMEYYASPVDVLQGAFGWTSYVAKGVLGTVEVAEDGSVDFLAPAEKVLFFELLDKDYNEIQRMRSVVQLQPGEQRSCVGCHESRLSAPEGGLTQASGREPQRLVPPPWGAGPFWYEQIVQPVLDRHCVECHNSDSAALAPRIIDLTGKRDENKIPNSYRSLIQSGAVHYFDYTWGGGKTTKAAPYTFGVSKSRLWSILQEEQHSGVRLDPEEEQAIKCWIDLNVPLWGDYEKRSDRD